MNFVPSIYQEKIFQFVGDQVLLMQSGLKPHNLACIAGAGCAKSTTLVKSLSMIPSNMTVSFLAFNKEIVEALKPKVSSNVRVQTFHSAGFGAIRYRYKFVKMVDNKMYSIFHELCESTYNNITYKEKNELRNPFLKLCGLVKNTCCLISLSNIHCIIDRYNLDIGDCNEEILFNMVKDGIKISNSRPALIDFDDMIYLPNVLDLSFYRVDIIFVDETQDLNNTQLQMLLKMVKSNGFIVCVGDPMQSIYGFRAADTDAMDKLITKLDSTVLPLQMTYRCGKNIVKLANELVPELEAYQNNPDGKIENINYDKFYEIVKEGDMVLCRNNAPLIRPVFHLLAKGIKVTIKGRDIGEGLITIIKKLESFTIDEFAIALDKWKEKEDVKAIRKKSDAMRQSIEDKYNCLIALMDDCENTKQIIDKIEKIFNDGRSQITFSSIHRAKGLEANRVFLLDPQLIPSKWASKDWEIQQERNLLYVAITRAKTELYMVGSVINTMF